MTARNNFFLKSPLSFFIFLFALLHGLHFLSALLPSENIKEKVKEAFEKKKIGLDRYLPHNVYLGAHQFNDCIILLQSFDRKNFVADALAPSTTKKPCITLKKLVYNETTNKNLHPYYRYQNGNKTIISFLLQPFSVSFTRELLSTLIYISLFFFLYYLNKAQGIYYQEKNRWILFYSLLGFSFLKLFGLETYRQSLCHALLDASNFIMAGIYCKTIISEKTSSISQNSFSKKHVLILWATLIAYFEFFTGGLPIALGLIISLNYFFNISLKETIKNLIFFSISFCALITFNIILKEILFTDFVLENFYKKFSLRISSTAFAKKINLYGVQKKVVSSFKHLHGGYRMIPYLFFLYAIGLKIFITFKKIRLEKKIYLWLPTILILSWFIVFKNHTYIHSSFMIRIIIIEFFSAFLFHYEYLQKKPS